MTTKTIDVHEAQIRLPELISSVETGAEIILTKDNTPIARLVPLATATMNRVAGLHVGSVWISPDFNEPLPDTFWAGEAWNCLPLAEIIASQRRANNIVVLPIALEHVLALETLPDHHKDPFDRLLIAQAVVEDAALISNDPLVQKYPVKLVW